MRTATTTMILQIVCEVYGLKEAELLTGGRGVAIFEARAVAMACIRQYTAISLADLGRLFNRKDHTTVYNALSRAETFLADTREGQACQRRVDALMSPETPRRRPVALLRPGGGAARSRRQRAA